MSKDWHDLEGTPKIALEYQCPKCWGKKHMIYKSYLIAKRNKVYCDFCITVEMRCITPNAQEKISTLN